MLIANDPYLTGTHISDTSVYVPVFHDGRARGVRNRDRALGRHRRQDAGGWCPDSTDVYQEGLCFTHQKLVDAGTPNRDLWDFIDANVRFPPTVRGDLDAQIAACKQGAARVRALCAKYGVRHRARVDAHSRSSRRTQRCRREIAKVPDGSYSASIELDHDGVLKDVRRRVALTLTVEGDRIRVSFDGTERDGERADQHADDRDPQLGARRREGLAHAQGPDERGALPRARLRPPAGADRDAAAAGAVRLVRLPRRGADGADDLARCRRPYPSAARRASYQLFGVYLFRVDPRDGTPFIFIDPIDGGHGGRPHARRAHR